MSWRQLQNKLCLAARKNPPSAEVPYLFEKRVMARLRSIRTLGMRDNWAAWARALWYGAGVCTAVALLMSLWTFAPVGGSVESSSSSSSFAEDLEQSILAPSAPPSGTPDNNWW